MICACIDIGSNTTRVLVAEVRDGQVVERLQGKAFTRIGAELRGGGAISPAKLEEVAGVVAEQARLAREQGCTRVRAVATAAIRQAPNGEELCACVADRAAVPVDVLGGEEEARLAFLGATRTLGRPLDGPVAVVDVGGGSTEIAVGTVASGVAWSTSLPIGSGLLADEHLASDPPSAPELDALRRHARAAFAGLAVPPAGEAVAVGGSAASLGRIVGPEVEPQALASAVGVLTAAPRAEIARRHDLDPERVRLLPAGILILDAVSRCLGRPLRIGRGGLREGVCLELARG